MLSSVCVDPPALAAAAIICSGVTVNETKTDSIRTANMGNKEAKVTTPKPESDEFPFPAAFAIPIPSDNTNGTVTGPVVTAPQSHAKPIMVTKSGSKKQYPVNITTGMRCI